MLGNLDFRLGHAIIPAQVADAFNAATDLLDQIHPDYLPMTVIGMRTMFATGV